MTNQQLFDRVVSHLLTQNAKAMSPALFGRKPTCVYYDPETGRKCAIGILIPEHRYTRSMEGSSCKQPIIMQAAGLMQENLRLAEALQLIHDRLEPYLWKVTLYDIARSFGLKWNWTSKPSEPQQISEPIIPELEEALV